MIGTSKKSFLALARYTVRTDHHVNVVTNRSQNSIHSPSRIYFQNYSTSDESSSTSTRSSSSNSSSSLLQSFEDSVLTLTLNRPKQRNALNLELLNDLYAILSKLKEEGSTQQALSSTFASTSTPTSPSVRAVLIQANGTAFCSGHDLKEIQHEMDSSYKPESEKSRERRHHHHHQKHQELFHLCSKVMQLWKDIPQPTISAVHGMATAAGCQLAASTDLVIASDTAQFATPGVQIGLFCSTPAVPLLRCIPHKIALDMLYTGRILSAHEAHMYGLVSRLVVTKKAQAGQKDIGDIAIEAALTQKEAHTIAKIIASKSSAAMGIGKKNIYKQLSCNSLEEAYDVASGAMVDNLEFEDAGVGIRSFLKKKVPEWKHR